MVCCGYHSAHWPRPDCHSSLHLATSRTTIDLEALVYAETITFGDGGDAFVDDTIKNARQWATKVAQFHNMCHTAQAVSSGNCVRCNPPECSKGIKGERECATSNKQPKHPLPPYQHLFFCTTSNGLFHDHRCSYFCFLCLGRDPKPN